MDPFIVSSRIASLHIKRSVLEVQMLKIVVNFNQNLHHGIQNKHSSSTKSYNITQSQK